MNANVTISGQEFAQQSGGFDNTVEDYLVGDTCAPDLGRKDTRNQDFRGADHVESSRSSS